MQIRIAQSHESGFAGMVRVLAQDRYPEYVHLSE